jgi:hypothetical protein
LFRDSLYKAKEALDALPNGRQAVATTKDEPLTKSRRNL